MKLLAKDGKLLMRGGKLIAVDNPDDCDCCDKWWCVQDSPDPNYPFYCIKSDTRPINAVGGPYDSQTDCEDVCGQTNDPWWCLRDLSSSPPRTYCVQSATQPPGSPTVQVVSGPHPTRQDCEDAGCGERFGWWCVTNDTQTIFSCGLSSATVPPTNAHSGPFNTLNECQNACGQPPPGGPICSVSQPGSACDNWLDDCSGAIDPHPKWLPPNCEGWGASAEPGWYGNGVARSGLRTGTIRLHDKHVWMAGATHVPPAFNNQPVSGIGVRIEWADLIPASPTGNLYPEYVFFDGARDGTWRLAVGTHSFSNPAPFSYRAYIVNNGPTPALGDRTEIRATLRRARAHEIHESAPTGYVYWVAVFVGALFRGATQELVINSDNYVIPGPCVGTSWHFTYFTNNGFPVGGYIDDLYFYTA